MTTSPHLQRRLGRVIALATAFVALTAGSAVFAMSPVAAQEPCVPTPDYPCPPPEDPPINATCALSVQAARVGTRVFAAVSGVPPGLLIQLTFNGTVVAQAVSTADETGAQALGSSGEFAAGLPRHGRAAPAQATGGALLSFLVPDVPLGTYGVRATGAGFNADCGAFTILAAAAAAGGGGGGGFMAFTGLNVALLLALALACLIVGRALVQASRERKRRREVSAPAHAQRELSDR